MINTHMNHMNHLCLRHANTSLPLPLRLPLAIRIHLPGAQWLSAWRSAGSAQWIQWTGTATIIEQYRIINTYNKKTNLCGSNMMIYDVIR